MAAKKRLSVFVKGLHGCAMRKQKVAQYRQFLKKRGYRLVRQLGEADIVLLWTCAFRADVRDSSLVEVRRLARIRSKRLVVTGCLPDIAPDMLQEQFKGTVVAWRDEARGLAAVFGGEPKAVAACRRVFIEPKFCDDAEDFRRRHGDRDVTFADEFIKLVVSEGCGYTCAYCSERLMFPPYLSFPEDALVSSARALIRKTGTKRVMLLADSLGEYGKDTGTSLPQLIRRLCAIRAGVQVALNNLNAADFIRFWKPMTRFVKRGMICHLNLPIQSASTGELRRMRRAYTHADLEKIFSFLKKTGFDAFDTHLIIGFPKETQADLRQTVDFLLTYKPRYVLLSRYMEMPHTPSARLTPKVGARTVARRLRMAERALSAAGIICNVEGGTLARNRWRRMRKGAS